MVTGTTLLSMTVCEREAWLIAHAIGPDQDNPFIEIGRLLHQESYREKTIREVNLPGIRIDLIYDEKGVLVVGEIKKSSKFLKGARIQLLHYLNELEKRGVRATGKILIPKEKKQLPVVLDDESREELRRFIELTERTIRLPKPPEKRRNSFCGKCGYELLCWS
ncbi:CRISPR-associated protein Cas4 [Thermotoga sp. Ku-13t]|uniref:CRISPR-associated protein Cas4 n=1 Tax=Thermotoga sp. Ku-13t TaxID=1755813 RepID=UPI0013EE3F29|nr:CRISPR-associated protein Cas4 [Thermotoga sp. Ku-13t]KAF2957809.1 CRISPR-associated protein Cas4 [Thermotoga sp. Ku-13t]